MLNNPSDFLEAVKNRLNITYNYKDNDLKDMINEGMASIQKWIGSHVFSITPRDHVDVAINKLLLNYVRYEWNGSSQYFESDYRSDILSTQLEVSKRAYKKNTKLI